MDVEILMQLAVGGDRNTKFFHLSTFIQMRKK